MQGKIVEWAVKRVRRFISSSYRQNAVKNPCLARIAFGPFNAALFGIFLPQRPGYPLSLPVPACTLTNDRRIQKLTDFVLPFSSLLNRISAHNRTDPDDKTGFFRYRPPYQAISKIFNYFVISMLTLHCVGSDYYLAQYLVIPSTNRITRDRH